MDEKFRSRKWMITCFVQAAATIGLLFNKLTGADFATISSAVIVSYSLANAAEHLSHRGQQ